MLFSLRGVEVVRNGRPVLAEVDLDLPDGAVALLGPSGSGKSTLLRLLNRLRDPDRGEVRYRGRDVRTLDPLALRREVVLVPQLPAPADGTVAENVALGPRLAGRDADVPRALELAGLAVGFADRDADQLSVGETQRVMLARALALQPRVLLLDEPTSALDAAARDAVERTLLELREQLGVALVLVTHDPAQAHRLAHSVGRLEGGRVVQAPAAPEPAA